MCKLEQVSRSFNGAVAGAIFGGLTGCLPSALLWVAYWITGEPSHGGEMIGSLSFLALVVFVPAGALVGAIIGAILVILARKPNGSADVIRNDDSSGTETQKQVQGSTTAIRDGADRTRVAPRDADAYFNGN